MVGIHGRGVAVQMNRVTDTAKAPRMYRCHGCKRTVPEREFKVLTGRGRSLKCYICRFSRKAKR